MKFRRARDRDNPWLLRIGFKPLERCFCHVPNMRGAAVKASLLAVLELEAKLGGNHHLIPERRQSLAHEFFVRKWPIDFRCVEERHIPRRLYREVG